MVEQKVAWTSNRPGFGTAQHHLAVCSTAAFFFGNLHFIFNLQDECWVWKREGAEEKKNRTEWKKNANSSETITGTQKMLQINTLQCETNMLTTHVTDSCATFISQEELNSVWLVNRFHTKISIVRTINQWTCNIFKHSSNLMRWFSSVSLVEFNPFLLTISFCSYPTHVYYSTKISKTISVCAPGMQGVFYSFLFFLVWSEICPKI